MIFFFFKERKLQLSLQLAEAEDRKLHSVVRTDVRLMHQERAERLRRPKDGTKITENANNLGPISEVLQKLFSFGSSSLYSISLETLDFRP